MARTKKERLYLRDWLLIALMFLINFEYFFVNVFGFDSIWKPYRIVAFIGALLVLPKLIGQREKYLGLMSPLLLSLACAIGLSLLLVAVEEADYDAVMHSLKLLSVGICLTLCAVAASMRAIRIGMFFLVLGLLVNLGYAWFIESSDFYRETGFFRNPNHLGTALGVACMYVVGIVSNRRQWLIVATLFILLAGIFLTGSRSALFAVLLVVLMGAVRQPGARVALVVLFLVGTLGYLSFGAELLEWLNSYQDGRLAYRFGISEITRAGYRKELAVAGLNLGLETGFIGVGISQFADFHYFYLVDSLGVLEDKYGHAVGIHNFYLILLVEWGLAATIFMVIFGKNLLTRTNRRKDDMGQFANRLIWMFVLVAATADITAYVHFWVAIGIVIAIVNSKPVKSQKSRMPSPHAFTS